MKSHRYIIVFIFSLTSLLWSEERNESATLHSLGDLFFQYSTLDDTSKALTFKTDSLGKKSFNGIVIGKNKPYTFHSPASGRDYTFPLFQVDTNVLSQVMVLLSNESVAKVIGKKAEEWQGFEGMVNHIRFFELNPRLYEFWKRETLFNYGYEQWEGANPKEYSVDERLLEFWIRRDIEGSQPYLKKILEVLLPHTSQPTLTVDGAILKLKEWMSSNSLDSAFSFYAKSPQYGEDYEIERFPIPGYAPIQKRLCDVDSMHSEEVMVWKSVLNPIYRELALSSKIDFPDSLIQTLFGIPLYSVDTLLQFEKIIRPYKKSIAELDSILWTVKHRGARYYLNGYDESSREQAALVFWAGRYKEGADSSTIDLLRKHTKGSVVTDSLPEYPLFTSSDRYAMDACGGPAMYHYFQDAWILGYSMKEIVGILKANNYQQGFVGGIGALSSSLERPVDSHFTRDLQQSGHFPEYDSTNYCYYLHSSSEESFEWRQFKPSFRRHIYLSYGVDMDEAPGVSLVPTDSLVDSAFFHLIDTVKRTLPKPVVCSVASVDTVSRNGSSLVLRKTYDVPGEIGGTLITHGSVRVDDSTSTGFQYGSCYMILKGENADSTYLISGSGESRPFGKGKRAINPPVYLGTFIEPDVHYFMLWNSDHCQIVGIKNGKVIKEFEGKEFYYTGFCC